MAADQRQVPDRRAKKRSAGRTSKPLWPQNRTKLACDYAVISDTSQFAPGMPAITYGLKGLAYFEIIVRGANVDLHSGTFGGAVANPLNALATILASLKGPDGRILIDGFYDPVRPLAGLGTHRVRRASVFGGRIPGEPRRYLARRRGRLHDPRTARPSARPATSTASTAATKVQAPRRFSPARRGRSSASDLCPTKIPKTVACPVPRPRRKQSARRE